MSFIHKIGVKTYVYVACGGAAAVMGMFYIQYKARTRQLLRWEAVQKSMDILEGYTHSDTIFGKPLKAALIDSSHEFYHGSKERATIPILFSGNKKNGRLYMFCSLVDQKSKEEKDWRIDRLDVEIYGDDSKRWTFYVDPNADMTKYSASKLNMKEDKT